MSIERLRKSWEIDVVWLPFPLHPEIPAAGMTLEELFPGRMAYIDAMRDRLRQRFAEEGLPLGDLDRVYNTRLAQELGKWADTQPNGEALHEAVFRAYFVDGENIGDAATLVRLAGTVGLDRGAAAEVLRNRAWSDAVDEDWDRAKALRLGGVPAFLAAGRGVVGAQPLVVLEELIRNAAADAGEPR